MEAPSPSTPSARPWVVCGGVLVLLVTVIRLILNFRHDLPPATDGAYYPMQTWWLIEHGRLMYDDLPLFFWLNAALARVIMMVTSLPLEDAAMLGSRLIDSTAQPLAAIFILLLGYAWSAGRRTALPGCVAAAVLAVFSPPILRMASDFQKNALGLVWMAAAFWAIRWALAEPRRISRWAVLAVVVFLSGLTHIGAFGATCIMLVTAGVAYCLAGGSSFINRRNIAWLVIGSVVGGVAGGVMLGLLWWFEPTRTEALLTAPWRLVNFGNLRPTPAIGVTVLACLALGLYLRWFWRHWATIQRCDKAVILGAVAACGVLVFPLFPQDYVQRFMLMTPVPAAVLLAFMMAMQGNAASAAGQAETPDTPDGPDSADSSDVPLSAHSRRPAKIFIAVVVLLAIPSPFMLQGPAISSDEADEIQSFHEAIPKPAQTLVVASHGLQYWAGLLLHTPVRMGQVPDDAFTRYSRVLMLQQTASSRRRQTPGGRNGPRQGPMDRRGPGSGGPEDGRTVDARDQRTPPGHHAVVIPEGAVLVGQTQSFKLYEIHPPVPLVVNEPLEATAKEPAGSSAGR